MTYKQGRRRAWLWGLGWIPVVWVVLLAMAFVEGYALARFQPDLTAPTAALISGVVEWGVVIAIAVFSIRRAVAWGRAYPRSQWAGSLAAAHGKAEATPMRNKATESRVGSLGAAYPSENRPSSSE